MPKSKWFIFILFFYVVFDPSQAFAYDQVLNEKAIPLVSKKSEPSVLRIDKDGGLWVLDRSNLTIQKISKEGKATVALKPGKKKEDIFREPVDFCFANDGTLVVADQGFGRVAFIVNGKLAYSVPVEKPSAVAVSRDDILAVASMDQRIVQLFSKDGVPLHMVFPPEAEAFKSLTAVAFSRDGVLWVLDGEEGKLHRFSSERKWLGVTSGLGESVSVAVDEFGFAYVTSSEGRWKEIDKEGKVSGTFGTRGKNPGQLSKPYGAALASASLLWVAEQGNNRLQLFSINNSKKISALTPQPAARIQVRNKASWLGIYKMGFVNAKGEVILFNQKKNQLERFDDLGKSQQTVSFKSKDKNRVISPEWFTEDKEGNLWVTDGGDHKVKKISSDGKVVLAIGEKGKKEGSLNDPSFVSIRSDLSMVVADRGNSRIQVLSPKGLFLFSVGGGNKGPGRFKTVSGLATSSNRIAVIDNEGKSLLFYDSNGKFLSAVSNPESGGVYWKELSGISVDADDRFYVMDKGSSRIRIFNPNGDFVGDFAAAGNRISWGGDKTLLTITETGVKLYSLHVVPQSLENLSASDEEGNIIIKWDPNPDASQYRIYRSTFSNLFSLLTTSSPTEILDGDVVPGVMYRYAVTGINAIDYEGNWTYSDPIKASRKKDVSLVSITSTTFNPVFTAAFKYYVTKPMGSITVKNNDAKPYRDLKISMSLKRYTDYPTETVIKTLDAGQELEVPVSMIFNDAVLELTENTPVQVEVRLLYFESNNEKIISQNAPLLLYSRNAISWTEPDRLSSFITPRDLPIVDFSKAAYKTFLSSLKTAAIGKPLAKVALLYESVNALGMSYVPDSKTPYAEVAGKPDVLDYVAFPRETLSRKLGDCDDTTALMASLLESIGVETAIVDTPSHVFLMANLEENDPGLLGFPVERFVEYKGSYWVPVETTKFGRGFVDSWQAGIAQVKAAQEKNLFRFVPVMEAAKKYPPVTLVEIAKEPVPYPEEKVKAAYLPLLEKLQKERYQNQLAAIKDKIQKNPEHGMLNVQMGLVHVEGGNVTEARNLFMAALKDPSVDVQAAAENNLGNLDYLGGNYKEAAAHYEAAEGISSDDGGVIINRARCAWKLGDETSAKKYLLEAKESMPQWRDFVTDMPAELVPAN